MLSGDESVLLKHSRDHRFSILVQKGATHWWHISNLGLVTSTGALRAIRNKMWTEFRDPQEVQKLLLLRFISR